MGLTVSRQKRLFFFYSLLSKMQIDINRQKVSRHFNLTFLLFQLIVVDFWLL